MKRFGNILKKFEQAMASAAFAEAGEFETARQMIQADKTANKKVLLGTEGGEVNPQLFGYALDLCRRLGGSLEILQVLPSAPETSNGQVDIEAAKEIPASFRQQLRKMGILYRSILARDVFAKEVVRYAGNRRDLLCVVLGAPRERAAVSARALRQQSTIFKRLSCPVVFYGDAVQV